jgi:hypothetical protein
LLIRFCLLFLYLPFSSAFFGIGYYAGRAREFNIRQRVCDDIKKQITSHSGEWLNGAVYVISRLNELTDIDDDDDN